MKIIYDIEQGSQEWIKLRLGKVTASNFSKIITRSGEYSKQADALAIQLASELFFNYADETYKSADMVRGTELEPQARTEYMQETLNDVVECSFVDCDDYGYSPDGLIGDDGLLEIKCPKATTHFKYIKDDKIPDEYYAQCQGGLMASGRQWIDFVSFHPDVKEEYRLFIKRCYRDEEFIDKLKFFINLTIQKRNTMLCKNSNTEFSINDTSLYNIEEIQSSENEASNNMIEITDESFINEVNEYFELEPFAEKFNKIKKIIESKTEAVHLANEVDCLEVGKYKVLVSYSKPTIYDEKKIDKAINDAKDKLENALNLEIGDTKSDPKFKCKIIKKS
jgi:predicted phage-related endonuclease